MPPTELCYEELETLAAIYLDDIEISETALGRGSTILSIVLYPATGDDKESRYVTLTLEIELFSEYPKRLPKIVFRNPRGLSENLLKEIELKLAEKCKELQGCQMVYQLIDMTKEFLTSNNRPNSECPICLRPFTKSDIFHRSECFHHFHAYCLGMYLKSLEFQESSQENVLPNEKIPAKVCPVCREDLPDSIDVNYLLEAPPPSEENDLNEEDTEATHLDWKEKLEAMNKLYMKQKSQGGIIDMSKKSSLLVISSPPTNQTHRQTDNANDIRVGSSNSQLASFSYLANQPPNRSNLPGPSFVNTSNPQRGKASSSDGISHGLSTQYYQGYRGKKK